jgi:hypothetical protein
MLKVEKTLSTVGKVNQRAEKNGVLNTLPRAYLAARCKRCGAAETDIHPALPGRFNFYS